MAGKYQAYSEYKKIDSQWVSEIPRNWQSTLFKRIVTEIKDGTHGTHARVSEGLPFLSAKNVQNNGIEISDSESMISEKDHKEITGNGFPKKGDLLITCVGTIGRTCVYEFDEPYAFQRSVAFLRLSKFAEPKFYKYFVESKAYQSQLEANSKASAQSGVYMGDLVSTSIVLPPNVEQLIISSFLDHETAKIDTLIDKQKQLIKLLKEKRQAVISHTVTKGLNPKAPMRYSGTEWLGQVPEHWEVRAVSKLSQKITNGYVGPTRDILVSLGVPYVQATHIKKGKVNFDDAYFVRQPWSDAHAKSILVKGDVLIVQTGAGTGDIGLVTDNEVGFNCHALIIVQPIKSIISGDFLSMAFQSQYGYSVLYSIRTGGMHPHLNCGEVQFVKIPVPPIEEQSKIIEHISKQLYRFDTLIDRQLLAIELMKERRTALISAAVTGKIDVRSWREPSSNQGAINA